MRAAAFFYDRRRWRWAAMLFIALVRVPLGTVVLEKIWRSEVSCRR